jgi:OOP family OmpA-OmpF porin
VISFVQGDIMIQKNLAMTFGFMMFLLFTSCQSKPPHPETMSSAAEPVEEIVRFENQLLEAENQQIDVLSPENFTDAKKSIEKAKKLKSSGKPDAQIIEQIANAKGWLKEAYTKAVFAEVPLKGIKDARGGALRAGAPQLLEKEWKRLNRVLVEMTSAIEKGNMTPADKKGTQLITDFRDLERASMAKSYLAIVDENLKSAISNGAQKTAPKSFEITKLKKENALRVIESNPRNADAIKQAAEDATRESVHLINVVSKVKAGNSEDLVLLAEKQQQRISSLQKEHLEAERELNISQRNLSKAQKLQKEMERTQDLEQKVDHLRQHFRTSEAEVYTENGKLKIRLKSLRFPAGQSLLGPKNIAVLKKVEEAIGDLPSKKIIIQGHADAREKARRQELLSKQRAVAVENYLTSNGALKKTVIEAEGMGAEKPISSNKTPQGRANNRRIELLIETE